jgi:hypothetical protein
MKKRAMGLCIIDWDECAIKIAGRKESNPPIVTYHHPHSMIKRTKGPKVR